jgi:Zn-dependent protease
MPRDPVSIFFQIVVLLFAISVHESAHAWMANRLGDPTARMLGRISLNPLVHIDLFGTILLPAMLILAGFPPFGYAKPTPVDNRNFKNPVRDDIFTAVAGPASNFLTAFVAVLILAVMLRGTPGSVSPFGHGADISAPLVELFRQAIWINVILAVFNLIPLPPLDGSHVIRHFLPYETLKVYDRVGYFGLVIVMFVLPMVGCSVVGTVATPVLVFFYSLLNALLRF